MPCEGCGVGEAALQCPTCKKLGLPPSFFCSQECFKKHWGDHKQKHTDSKNLTANIPTMTAADEKHFNFTGPLRPGKITPRRAVPKEIARPDYAERNDGVSESEEKDRGSNRVIAYNLKQLHDDYNDKALRANSDILKIKRVCALSREVLDIACEAVKPGVTTDEIDRIVHEATIERGMYPSPLNYYNFPKSVCTSINEIICHGIPDNRPLEEGDIVNLDVSCYLDGFHGDLNETVFVGKPDKESVKLVHTAYACMMAGIKVVKPEELYRYVGDAIEARADKSGCSVVRSYTGHGIGRLFHTTPSISHFKDNKTPGLMKPGHVFTIEPMINLGVWQDVTWPDNWTSTTKDGKRSAQFEHTLVCTPQGYELLTDWKDGVPFYQRQLKKWGIPIPAEDPSEIMVSDREDGDANAVRAS
ncbi:methionine aminopeptidase putative metallo-peptidase Clan MG Family M24 [Leptomonas seymouri]|uniref:Methionine aminopeptidase n=1 Tax=Leptomonas seymouri TaxID=5684 RepID=A0A0N1PEB6_LEPSE|nr:methionine aminopeptidase putative metallo-peptidase Clan MG Family M24 [Leptomonas seymouri]|eukprot:KPI90075.1 methionine aminopeptidase putative metallo-peptidase Clan MG Family M24 [Leptomonas seymouri]